MGSVIQISTFGLLIYDWNCHFNYLIHVKHGWLIERRFMYFCRQIFIDLEWGMLDYLATLRLLDLSFIGQQLADCTKL